jgi:hypothetical protein
MNNMQTGWYEACFPLAAEQRFCTKGLVIHAKKGGVLGE